MFNFSWEDRAAVPWSGFWCDAFQEMESTHTCTAAPSTALMYRNQN